MASLPSDLSILRRRLRELHEEQLQLLHVMMDCGPMIVGSLYQSFRTCSHPNCRCHQGQKHGPFPTISFSVEGRHRSRPIRADDVESVTRKAGSYRRFKTALTRWRALHRQAEAILERIRQLNTEEYR